jgi:hypothetical protein
VSLHTPGFCAHVIQHLNWNGLCLTPSHFMPSRHFDSLVERLQGHNGLHFWMQLTLPSRASVDLKHCWRHFSQCFVGVGKGVGGGVGGGVLPQTLLRQ